jgi:hypothetical protein
MPRRNRVRRRKQQLSKRRTVMSERGTFLGGKQVAQTGVKLEPLVKADGRCYNERTGKYKIAFNTEEKAALALSAARKNHEKLGHTERIESRYYKCPIEDRGGAEREHFHLTHKEERASTSYPGRGEGA